MSKLLEEAKEKASEILEKLGYEIPVRVRPIADYYGYQIQKIIITDEKLLDVAGAVSYKTRIIYYNPNDSFEIQRFWIGCEIGNIVLNGDYDYLLMIESDVFTGECIIENLVSYAEAYRASIVTATYEIQQDEAKLCLTSTVDGLAVRSEKILPRELGYSIMGRGCVPLQKLMKDPDARLTATGIGCTLFGREVLEGNKFRVDLELNAGAFSDTFIFSDALRQGYEVLINSDLICEHRK